MATKKLDELARRLAAAVVSYKLGISLRQCYDTYMKGQPPGAYWLKLAERIIADEAGGSLRIPEDPRDN